MSYLEEYLRKVEDFPLVVNQHLRKIKDLDNTVQQTQLKLDILQEKLLEQQNKQKNKKIDQRKLIPQKKQVEKLQNECIQLSQQKMQESDKLYSIVDDSIKELESDIKVFEQEIKQNNQTLNTDQYKSTLNGSNRQETLAERKKKKYEAKFLNKYSQEKKNEKLLQNALEREREIISEWQINPNEPTYCYCNSASYGEMIKCDNDYCEKEWFHYACVNLQQPPSGKWLCKSCKQSSRKNNDHLSQVK